MKTLKDAPIVAAESQVVLSTIPGNGVGEGVGLVEFTARHGVVQTTKRGEADSRQSPVKGVVRNAANACTARTSYILHVRIEVGRGDVIVVVVKTQNICGAAFAISPASGGVQPLRGRAPVQ